MKHEELINAIREEIRTTVNGKIDKITVKLDDYIKEDMEWKERAEPMIKTYEHSNWAFKMFTGGLKILGLIGGAVGGIYALNKIIK